MAFDLKRYLAPRRAAVNTFLRRTIPRGGPLQEAMRYSLFAGGKRLRPILVLAAAELASKRWRPYLATAGAAEMVHTYSLIHDDLPAMDDDDMRRGKPTCHRKFGEATAILAGDALNTMAFEVLASQAKTRGVKGENIARCVGELALASGRSGMVGGQVLDLAGEGKRLSLADLKEMHLKKTGALISACLRIGFIVGGGGDSQIKKLDAFGRDIGLAFQVVDDVLDAVGKQGKTGKDAGSDKRKGKYTFVSHYGVSGARREAEKLARRARASLAAYGNRAEALHALADYVVQRDR